MATGYTSPYSGPEIDERLRRAGASVQGVKVNGVEAGKDEEGKVNIPIPIPHPYLSLERVRPYLYKVTFDSLLEDNGEDVPVIGGCSAYVQDGKLYRNYDWNYDNAASFIVRTRDFEGMSMITGLDDGAMDDSKIAQLPFRVVDGRNNSGIRLSTHILFNDWEWTGAGDKSIPLTRLPYEVLTRVKSMATIASDLSGVLENLTSTPGLDSLGYLIQLLVTDGTTTYALIPPTSDGEAYELVNSTANPKMSNFRWVNRSTVVRADSDIQNRPTGIERFNLMPCPLEDLRFTKAYETPDRLSEFIGIRETTKDSTDAELEAIYDDARALYLERTRDGQTWQTMHSVVYGDRMEHLYIQEDWSDDIVASGVSKEYVDSEIGRVENEMPTKTSDLINDSDFQTEEEVNSAIIIEASRAEAAEALIEGDIDAIEQKIPEQASSSNKLADKAFVNSSVQTAAANFRGNWATKSAIPTDYTLYPADYTGNKKPTTNDYLVIQADESEDGGTWRYKYTGDWDTDGINGWNAEYKVNETPLTSAQLAALNSGVTAAKVLEIGGKYVKPQTGIPASDLESGVIPDVSGFITKSVNDLLNYYLKSEIYTKSEVQTLINAVKQFTYEVVPSLPTASSSTMHKIYLVPSSEQEIQNIKDEFITILDGSVYKWEQIGSTAIDLSDYPTFSQMNSAINTALGSYTTTIQLTALLNQKQDVISDLANIREGAGLGATAYQKPQSGIPSTDLAPDVQTTLEKVTSLEQNVGTLQTTVAGHTTAITSLQTSVAANTTSIASLQSEIDAFIGAQTNFLSFFPDVASLPASPANPSWAMVGADIDALNAYVWNGTAWAMFGTKTYDFTGKIVSIVPNTFRGGVNVTSGGHTLENGNLATQRDVRRIKVFTDNIVSNDAVYHEIVTTVTPVDGYAIRTAGTEYAINNYRYYKFPVDSGEGYDISAYCGGNYRLWLVADANGNILSYSQDSSGTSKKEEQVTIPANGEILYVNAYVSSTSQESAISVKRKGYIVDSQKVYVGTTPLSEYLTHITDNLPAKSITGALIADRAIVPRTYGNDLILADRLFRNSIMSDGIDVDRLSSATKVTGKYYHYLGYEVDSELYSYYILPVAKGDVVSLQGTAGGSMRLWIMMNGDTVVSYDTDSSATSQKTAGITIPEGVTSLIMNTKEQNQADLSWESLYRTEDVISAHKVYVNGSRNIKDYVDGLASNNLTGKVLCCCGDSITYGADMDEEGIAEHSDIEMYQWSWINERWNSVTENAIKSFGYQIAARNKMIFFNNGVGGSTVQGIPDKYGFSVANGRYTQLPDQIDYLTIFFGYNDNAYGTLGSINDSTNESFYGGYNVVLPYLLNKYPYAKIALIVPFGTPQGHRDAVRSLANRWGVACFDMAGAGTPLFITKDDSVGVDASVVSANREKFLGVGIHPNYKGHRQIADMLEHFLHSI